jgi:hypothetical protein
MSTPLSNVVETTVQERIQRVPKIKESMVVRGFTITGNEYMTIRKLCAYNELKGQKPDNTSELVRDALEFYFNNYVKDEEFWRLMDSFFATNKQEE